MPKLVNANFLLYCGFGEFQLSDSDNKTAESETNSGLSLNQDFGSAQLNEEAAEESTTIVPSSPQNVDSNTPSQLGFSYVYLWFLVPAVLLALFFAWYSNRGNKTKGPADSNAARGRFKKTDRLLNANSLSSVEVVPRVNFEIDDEIFACEKISSKSNSNEQITTTDGIHANGSDEQGTSIVSDEDEELMFGRGKEAAFEQLMDQARPLSSEPDSASSEPSSEADFVDADESPKRTIWRKKKFPPRPAIEPSGANVVSPENESDKQNQATDQRDNTAAASKTVASELTLAEFDSFEVAEDFADAERESVQRELNQAKTQIDELTSSFSLSEEKNSELQARTNQLELEINKQKADFNELAETIEVRTNESAQLKHSLEAEVAKSTKYQEQLAGLDVVRSDLESARVELATALEKLEATENRNSDLQSRLDAATTESDSLEKTRADKEEELTRELECASLRETDLKKQIASLQTIANEADTTQQKVLALTQQLEQSQLGKDLLEQRVSEADANTERLSESKREIIDLREHLKVTEEAKAQLQLELDMAMQAAKRLDEITQENSRLTKDLEKLEQEKHVLAATLDDEKVRAIELEERSRQLDDKVANINLLEDQVDSLKKELKETRAKNDMDARNADSQNQPVSKKTKTKFTNLYRAYERERRLRKELEANLTQAEEQRDQIANDFKKFKKSQDS